MLCLITPEVNLENEQALLYAMYLENPEVLIHVRKPKSSKEEVDKYLDGFPKDIRNQIVIHNYVEAKEKFGLRGVHLSERYWSVNGFSLPCLSLAIHSLSDLTNSSNSDYSFLSPVFDSISKKHHKARFSNKKLENTLFKINKKVIAVGGINKENIQKAKDLGFSGIGVLGAVWEQDSPYLAFKEINKEWKKNFC